jgi:hypothetical protein
MKESWESLIDMSIIHPTILPQTSSGNQPIIGTIPRIAYDDFFGMIELSHIGISFRRQAREPIDTTHIITAFGTHPTILSHKLDLNPLEEAKRK